MFHISRLLPLLLVALLTLYVTVLPKPDTTQFKLSQNTNSGGPCCLVEDIVNSTGDFEDHASDAIFDNQTITYPEDQLAKIQAEINYPILGVTTNNAGEEKWIEVDLKTQTVRAWEGNKIVREFLVSTGVKNYTPKGTYYIWYKTRFQRMKGGSKEDGSYYDLPNVPYNMFFHKGYALHGAYWHNNFGTPWSHGCVNEPVDQAKWMFEWAGPVVPEGKNYVKTSADNPGTKVFVH